MSSDMWKVAVTLSRTLGGYPLSLWSPCFLWCCVLQLAQSRKPLSWL